MGGGVAAWQGDWKDDCPTPCEPVILTPSSAAQPVRQERARPAPLRVASTPAPRDSRGLRSSDYGQTPAQSSGLLPVMLPPAASSSKSLKMPPPVPTSGAASLSVMLLPLMRVTLPSVL